MGAADRCFSGESSWCVGAGALPVRLRAVREIAEIFADLPSEPAPEDWDRIAEVLIEEAETRTAELRARLGDMRSGTKLCEIAESVKGHT